MNALKIRIGFVLAVVLAAMQPCQAALDAPGTSVKPAPEKSSGSVPAASGPDRRSVACASCTKGSLVVEILTSEGTVFIELFRDKAPKTVENFVRYVDSDFYRNTVFHRVIKGFMIQGGGFDPAMLQKPVSPPVVNEARNGLRNQRGTIAMARTPNPDSATSQFFINHADNAMLDYPKPDGYGYAVFGKVVQGMDVVDRIAAVRTGTHPSGHQNVPLSPVVIRSAKIFPTP